MPATPVSLQISHSSGPVLPTTPQALRCSITPESKSNIYPQCRSTTASMTQSNGSNVRIHRLKRGNQIRVNDSGVTETACGVASRTGTRSWRKGASSGRPRMILRPSWRPSLLSRKSPVRLAVMPFSLSLSLSHTHTHTVLDRKSVV